MVAPVVSGLVVFALSFPMVMSPKANQDNRTFSPNTIVRYALTQSEPQAANTVSNIYDGKVTGDKIYKLLECLPKLDGKMVSIYGQLYSRNFTASGTCSS